MFLVKTHYSQSVLSTSPSSLGPGSLVGKRGRGFLLVFSPGHAQLALLVKYFFSHALAREPVRRLLTQAYYLVPGKFNAGGNPVMD